MNPTPMTRAEYEAKYGLKPVVATSTIDTTPAPIRMTRDEYYDTYGKTPEGDNRPLRNLQNRRPFFPASVGGAETIPGNVARTIGNIPSSAINMARIPIDIAGGLIEADKKALETISREGYVGGAKKLLGGLADSYLKFGEAAYGSIDKAYNALLDNPGEALSKASTEIAKLGIEDPLFIPSLIYGGGVVGKKDIITKIASPFTRGADTSIPAIGKKIVETAGDIRKDLAEGAVRSTADEIYAVEQNYASGRKANIYSNDGGAESRVRIARSGVLDGAVTSDGVILTKQPGGAVEKYRAATVDGYEDVVKRGLEREGARANLEEVRRALVLEINRSGLEGADLVTAMNGVEKEIAGLALRADESNNVLLAKLQDAKISTTRNINYQTPPETSTYRKAVARAYKNTIERKSTLPIQKVNQELAKFYEDIKRIEGLDGKRVKGGRLGKYSAQVAGNIVGGLAGGAIGGVGGATVGTLVGGEVTSAIKGKSMASSFGKVKKGEFPESKVLATAKANAEAPKIRDLKTPDPVVGVRKDIPKTKEIVELESQIKNNVKQQKVAIKAGDFTLVQKLKEIYDVLVAKLKEVVQELTNFGPPMRGFIKIGDESTSGPMSPKSPLVKSPQKKTTTKAQKSQEAFEGFTDLSTKLLEKLKGRTTVSRQFIEDLSNSPDLKQAERDLIRRVLGEDGGETFYRGEGGSDVAQGKALLANGRHFAMDSEYPKRFGEVKAYTAKPDAKVFDASGLDFPEIRAKLGLPKSNYLSPAEYTKALKENGYDILKYDGTYQSTGKPFVHTVEITEGSLIPKSDQISVPDFANRVKSELLPLEREGTSNGYSGIALPDGLRGPIRNYSETVYSSPIKTSAGAVHFSGNYQNYFAHTRIEDLPDNTRQPDRVLKIVQGTSERRPFKVVGDGVDQNFATKAEAEKALKDFAVNTKNEMKTRRVIEIQSDLFQKGRLEGSVVNTQPRVGKNTYKEISDDLGNKTYELYTDGKLVGTTRRKVEAQGHEIANAEPLVSDVAKLEPYRNTWHERVIREEVKQAAKDGKTKLQFPTGETAMKIEGLGQESRGWVLPDEPLQSMNRGYPQLDSNNLKVGLKVRNDYQDWIITEVLGDGKFKAVPKRLFNQAKEKVPGYGADRSRVPFSDVQKYIQEQAAGWAETFDISGKVDTENPIYKFYEKEVGKYLKNKYGATLVTDPQGVKWWEVQIKPEMKKLPIEAFGVGAVPLLTQNEDE